MAVHMNARRVVVALSAVGVLGAVPVTGASGARSIYVSVEDHGVFVDGLAASSFELAENGIPVPFRIEPIERPANIMVLVENTARLHEIYGRYVPSALTTLARVAPVEHWYTMASVGDGVAIETEPTHDPSAFVRIYDHELVPSALGEPALWAATYQMIERLDRLPGRRALIVIASGHDSSWEQEWASVLARLERTDIVVYVCGIGVGDGGYEGGLRPGQSFTADAEAALRTLSEVSGGRARFPLGQFAVPAAVADLVRHFEHQYRIVYESELARDGDVDDITVRAYRTMPDGTRQKLSVTSRAGWRAFEPDRQSRRDDSAER